MGQAGDGGSLCSMDTPVMRVSDTCVVCIFKNVSRVCVSCPFQCCCVCATSVAAMKDKDKVLVLGRRGIVGDIGHEV